MEKKTVDLGLVAADAKNGVRSLWNKAKAGIVKVADKNDDGTLDLNDVSMIVENVSNATKNTANALKTSVEERSRELERKMLQPIFAEDLDAADFALSKLVRVTEMDKRRAESEVCRGSIGYISMQKELRIINIYKEHINAFGLSFYPDAECELYYVDPSDRDKFIALDDYFSFLKIARVNELQKIAQDLGAKHFRVTYKEQKTAFSSNSKKGSATAKQAGNTGSIDAEIALAATAVSTVEVAAEMDCPGHAPMVPKLRYLQREPSIQTLIALRMDEKSPIMHQKYTLKLSNSSGIKEKDAIKIDAALKSMKITGNTTIVSEVRNESRRFFEYEIDF